MILDSKFLMISEIHKGRLWIAWLRFTSEMGKLWRMPLGFSRRKCSGRRLWRVTKSTCVTRSLPIEIARSVFSGMFGQDGHNSILTAIK
jgi:hypothetical protein